MKPIEIYIKISELVEKEDLDQALLALRFINAELENKKYTYQNNLYTKNAARSPYASLPVTTSAVES